MSSWLLPKTLMVLCICFFFLLFLSDIKALTNQDGEEEDETRF